MKRSIRQQRDNRFLADENIPGLIVEALRLAGHDAAWVREGRPGLPDPPVLAWAARESRVLLTFDTDFGQLARGADLPSSCGIILLRIAPPRSVDPVAQLAALLSARKDWAGRFSVVEAGRVRMRPIDVFS